MDSLPRNAPADPLPLAAEWLDAAERHVARNPWAMALATVGGDRPAVRYVLLKGIDPAAGCIVFYTNYGSRKAAELDARGRAAAALYWPEPGRQLRFEGRIERSPASESDTYFASRPRQSQLNAWASEQSRPIASPDLMADKVGALAERFGATDPIPRPAGWGGYRLYADAVEFWIEGADRFHERLRYTRAADGHWSSQWLQP
jgi:pyridoxamine 5'-phosphate oxidase